MAVVPADRADVGPEARARSPPRDARTAAHPAVLASSRMPTLASDREPPRRESRRAAEGRRPGWAAQASLVVRKDLQIELRSGEVTTTSCFFALLVVIIASMSFYGGPSTRALVAAGAVWLAIAFSAVLALGRSWQREREDGALTGLLVTPMSRSALFAGKSLALLSSLFLVELVVVPVAAVLFALELGGPMGVGLVAILAVGSPGIAATATLFGAMTVRTRARELILAIVLFPLLAPILLTAVAGTRALFAGSPLVELGDYLALMGVFDGVFIAGGLAMFEGLIDG